MRTFALIYLTLLFIFLLISAGCAFHIHHPFIGVFIGGITIFEAYKYYSKIYANTKV